jgi:hypothetical protein
MIRIHPDGETFATKIHTDPCCPVVRTVVSTVSPDIGDHVCVSGMTTRALCGLTFHGSDEHVSRCHVSRMDPQRCASLGRDFSRVRVVYVDGRDIDGQERPAGEPQKGMIRIDHLALTRGVCHGAG